jgi:GT2 family glycosyltransferase
MTIENFGLIIPTLGLRPDYLRESIQSALDAQVGQIVIVAPSEDQVQDFIKPGLATYVEDPKRGLAAAINVGERALSESTKFFNWLGDDDRLTKDSVVSALEVSESNVSFVFGNCEYIDHLGNPFLKIRSGRYALTLMRFGPDLVPQPGAVINRDAFNRVGRLDETLKWAFDLDLFIRLSKDSRPRHIDLVLAQFRWHAGSLTAGQRKGSITESALVRRRHLPIMLRAVSSTWEAPGQLLSAIAGRRLNKKVSALSNH